MAPAGKAFQLGKGKLICSYKNTNPSNNVAIISGVNQSTKRDCWYYCLTAELVLGVSHPPVAYCCCHWFFWLLKGYAMLSWLLGLCKCFSQAHFFFHFLHCLYCVSIENWLIQYYSINCMSLVIVFCLAIFPLINFSMSSLGVCPGTHGRYCSWLLGSVFKDPHPFCFLCCSQA